MSPGAILEACEGYCLSRLTYHKGAILAYKTALEKGFDAPAIVYNNLGFTYLATGQMSDAEDCLHRAIALDNNLQIAHYNMAIFVLQRALHGQPVHKADLTDAIRCLEIGPCTVNHYYVAANLFARAAGEDSTLIPTAVQYVGKAVELGYDPKEIRASPSFSRLREEPMFLAALQRPVLSQKSPRGVQLADPLGNP